MNIPLIVEESIDMINEYHCEAIIKERKILFLSYGRYFEPSLILKEKAVSGSVNVKHEEHAEEIRNLLIKVINALEIDDGVVHLEVFYTNKGILVGEIGCRPAGGLISDVVKKQYGINLWDYYMALNLGEELDPIELKESEKYQGWLGLTCKEGQVTDLTPSSELLKIEEVKKVIDLYNIGDYVDPRWKGSTIFFSKLIFFELNKLEDLEKLRQKLTDIYYIETSPYNKHQITYT